jgi:hypothetical protein
LAVEKKGAPKGRLFYFSTRFKKLPDSKDLLFFQKEETSHFKLDKPMEFF